MTGTYKLTTASCFVGTFVQAIISNMTAVLFIPLMELYGLSYIHLGILVAVNFGVQVCADLVCSLLIGKVSFKKLVIPANILSFAGILLFSLSPSIFKDNVFVGIVLSTVVFSFAGGLLEVMLSPIIDAIPAGDRGTSMTMFHSFYAWGQIACILIITLFIFLFGGARWRIIVAAIAVVPFVNLLMFLFSRFPEKVEDTVEFSFKKVFFSPFYVLALLAIAFGAATEITMNQWASSFAENGLGLDKITGDLVGMCGFALMLGLARTLHGKFGAGRDLHRLLVWGSALSLFCYFVAALSPFGWVCAAACAVCGFGSALLWPGTLAVTSARFPLAGSWIFAILAVAGDVGGSASSWITGAVTDSLLANPAAESFAQAYFVSSEQAAMRLSILAAAAFPLMTLVVHMILKKLAKPNGSLRDKLT